MGEESEGTSVSIDLNIDSAAVQKVILEKIGSGIVTKEVCDQIMAMLKPGTGWKDNYWFSRIVEEKMKDIVRDLVDTALDNADYRSKIQAEVMAIINDDLPAALAKKLVESISK